MSNLHKSVLLNEAVESLNLKDDSVIVDCTLGYAGHSSEILKRIKKGYLFAFDQDTDAIKFSSEKLSNINNNYEIIKSNFVNIKEELEKRNIKGVDGILYDLGVSSPQLYKHPMDYLYPFSYQVLHLDEKKILLMHLLLQFFSSSRTS